MNFFTREEATRQTVAPLRIYTLNFNRLYFLHIFSIMKFIIINYDNLIQKPKAIY